MSAPLKILVVGNGSAGKTSICSRFRTDTFGSVYKQFVFRRARVRWHRFHLSQTARPSLARPRRTVGVDFYEKKTTVRGKPVTLQVWDVGGQSIGSSMLQKYLGGATAAFIVFDTTDRASFLDAGDWLRALRAEGAGDRGGGGPKDVWLLGNKADLEANRGVSLPTAREWASQQGLRGTFFVSARTGEGIATAFAHAAAAAFGMTLTDDEVALTVRVLDIHVGVVTARDDVRVQGADDIERADAELEARKRGRPATCCAIT